MNSKKIIFTFSAIILILLSSCNSKNSKNNDIKKDTTLILTDTIKKIEENTDTAKIKTKADVQKLKKEKFVKIYKYICPQGDKEGNSDIEGICPICEMELIENPNYKK